ncbi:hypothetical protein [Sphingobium sp. HWE2-09]|uniref:hypothetical protein n=1 Tax=Sphingobium sp. HWE2-09 TaxID=3108390 RepID=UPI002DCA5BC0|nr:hypothetical protein [Sphingobium sp. HWE2-09]
MTPDESDPLPSPFVFPDVAEAVSRAIDKRADEIIRAADAGEPPVTVLISDLGELIGEGIYWRNAERKIKALLTPAFETAGKKRVGLTGLAFGRCYRRTDAPPICPHSATN